MGRVARMGGEAMTFVAGNFARVLQIDAQGGVWLQGPLELAAGQTLSTLYAWLWQTPGNRPGGVATAVLDGARFDSAAARQDGGARWGTKADVVHGQLRAGPATGMALAVLTRGDGSTDSYWWSDNNIHVDVTGPAAVQALGGNILVADVLQAAADILRRQ